MLDDMGAAGIRNAVVLASGYREVGESGRAAEDAMVARAVANGITVLGPNCLGFINAHTRSAPYALTLPPPLTAGPVGVALQSGALASVVLTFAKAHAIGLSVLTSMGNESMMKTADVLDYLIEDEATKVICLFLEEIGDPARFAQAAERADRAGKPIVALKVGSSPAGQQAALAHTGSVAGDDAVADAALRQLNIIRVTSLEDLLTTGALLGYNRWPRGRRMGVLTASGGSCDIIADAASHQGLRIPDFAPETTAALGTHLPSFASVHNPLDVTGYSLLANMSGRTSPLTALEHALDIAVDDPNLDFILFSGLNLPEVRSPDEATAAALESRADWLARRIATSPIPVIQVGSTCVDVSPYGRQLLGEHGMNTLGGLNAGIEAIGHAIRWRQNRGRVQPAGAGKGRPARPPGTCAAPGAGPVVRGAGAGPADPAGRAGGARRRGRLGHEAVADRPARGAAGGAEDLLGADHPQVRYRRRGARAAAPTPRCEPVTRRSAGRRGEAARPARVIDGVLVTPMRSGGTELLAGVRVDPTFGPVLAVGLGGVWVEVLKDISLRVLPVDAAEVRQMLGELRGAAAAAGARGTAPANLDAVAEVIAGSARSRCSLTVGRCGPWKSTRCGSTGIRSRRSSPGHRADKGTEQSHEAGYQRGSTRSCGPRSGVSWPTGPRCPGPRAHGH